MYIYEWTFYFGGKGVIDKDRSIFRFEDYCFEDNLSSIVIWISNASQHTPSFNWKLFCYLRAISSLLRWCDFWFLLWLPSHPLSSLCLILCNAGLDLRFGYCMNWNGIWPIFIFYMTEFIWKYLHNNINFYF